MFFWVLQWTTAMAPSEFHAPSPHTVTPWLPLLSIALCLQATDLKSIMALRLSLTAEDANRNLHKFKGKAELSDERLLAIPLSPGADGQPAKNAGGWCVVVLARDTVTPC